MTRELYQRTEALERKVQALLDEGVTSAQRDRVAERLGVTDDDGKPDGDALTTPEDEESEDNE